MPRSKTAGILGMNISNFESYYEMILHRGCSIILIILFYFLMYIKTHTTKCTNLG